MPRTKQHSERGNAALQQRVAAARYVPLAFAEYLDMEESVLAVLRKQQDNRPRC